MNIQLEEMGSVKCVGRGFPPCTAPPPHPSTSMFSQPGSSANHALWDFIT